MSQFLRAVSLFGNFGKASNVLVHTSNTCEQLYCMSASTFSSLQEEYVSKLLRKSRGGGLEKGINNFRLYE